MKSIVKSSRIEWNIVNGAFIGLCMSTIVPFLPGIAQLTATLPPWIYTVLSGLLGGVVAGTVARRDGWKAGLLLGVAWPIMAIVLWLLLFLSFPDVTQEALAHWRQKQSDSFTIFSLLIAIPLSTMGGYGVDRYRAWKVLRNSQSETKIHAWPQTDWSVFYGILSGFLVASICFGSYLAEWQSLMLSAMVAGAISRRNGWMTGTLFGLLFFAIAAYFVLSVARDMQVPGTRSYEINKKFPFDASNELIRRLSGAVPLCAFGGLMGGWLRTAVIPMFASFSKRTQ